MMGWQFWVWLNVGLVPVAIVLVGAIACGGLRGFAAFALRGLLALVEVRPLENEE